MMRGLRSTIIARAGRTLLLPAVLGASLTSVAPARALTEPQVIAPAGPWNIDYAADSCKLRRLFGTGTQQVEFDLQQRGPGADYEIMLSGTEIRELQTRTQLTVRLGEAYDFKLSQWAAATTAGGVAIIRFKLGNPEKGRAGTGIGAPRPEYTAPGALNAVTYVDIASGKLAWRLNTGVFTGPINGLNRCVDDLVRGWGLDPAQQRSLSRPVRAASNPALWLDSGDYPAAMLAANRGAIVEFRLMVSATGAVTGCHIQSGLSYAGFEARTCAGISRSARFDAALDAAGKPVASFYINTVRWELG